MSKDSTKILEGLTKTLEGTIPKFKELKTSAEQILNQVISQEMESEMTTNQKQMLKGARNAYNLKGVGLEEKLEELTKLMKQCQHG